MPRFGIKAQVSLLSLGFLAIPWFAWTYWQEIQETAIAAQGRVQLIETKAIATSLVATQANIADLLAADEDSELEKYALSAPSLMSPIRLDGDFSDWTTQQETIESFNSGFSVWESASALPSEAAFGLAVAQNENYLFLALNVRDNRLQFRKPNHLRLDLNDHVQLTYENEAGKLQRVIIPSQGEGNLASYFTDADWKYGVDIQDPGQRVESIISSHKTGIQGYWQATEQGYAIELRIAKAQLYGVSPRLHVAVVDVDSYVDSYSNSYSDSSASSSENSYAANQAQLGPAAIIASLPKHLEDQLNPLGLHARELQRVIDQLKNTYARLWIYDRLGREWAYASRESNTGVLPISFETECVQNALTQANGLLQYVKDGSEQLSRIIACYPIVDQGKTLGVVVIDESASHVLAQEEHKVKDIALRLGAVVVIILVVLFAYAVVLVRRIVRLSSESQLSIDSHGRIQKTKIEASKNFPDELGDLSRSMSTLLEKQKSYTAFLERIPQTLRHEISNPLNKLGTSLELLLDSRPELNDDRYVKRLESATDQIGKITAHLTEAASLESAMQAEVLTEIDLNKFLARYFASWDAEIEVQAFEQSPFVILGDASRLEQLFDKLLDNACSFRSPNGSVIVRVEQKDQSLEVFIENDGPLLDIKDASHLFSPMVSTRSSGAEIHLGLGLHIAKLIADKHRAILSAQNRRDGSGVVFSVSWRRA